MDAKHGKLKDAVNITVHQNPFSEEQTSYAKVQRQTAYMGDVVDKAIELKGDTFGKGVLLLVAEFLRDAILALLKSGKAVDLLELGILYLTAKGGIEGLNPTASDIPPVDVDFTPSAMAKKAVEGVSVSEPMHTDTSPSVKYFLDVTTCKKGTAFTAKGSIKVIGLRLKIAGNKSDVGVFFAPQKDSGGYDDTGADWIQVDEEHLAENTPGRLLFTLPATLQTDKKYTAIIKTAYAGGKRLAKNAKSSVIGSDITVA